MVEKKLSERDGGNGRWSGHNTRTQETSVGKIGTSDEYSAQCF